MRLIHRLAFCLVTAIPVAALAACSSSGSSAVPTGAAPEVSSITLDVVPTADAAGIYIAQDKGYFAQQGLTVKISYDETGDDRIGDLQSGAAQLVEGNYVSFIQAQLAGQFNGKPVSMRMVSDVSAMQPGNNALYVMPNSPYKSVQALVKAHAKVGVNAPDNVGTVLFGSLLALNGAKPSGLDEVPETLANMPALLARGTIAAAWLDEPLGTIAEQDFGAVQLADFDEGSLQNWPMNTIVGSTAWVQSHPNTVAAFNRAFDEGQQVADTNRQAVEAAVEKNTPGMTPLIADNMTIESYPLSMVAAVMQRVPDAMYEFGIISKPFQISSMIQPASGQ